jgi:flagellar assembly protein FliH
MKPLPEMLRFTEPLRSVRLLSCLDASSAADLEQRLRARYEQGLRDGEKALREQLVQQRSDLLQLQQGILRSLQQTFPQVRTECEAALVDLALAAAQKLVAALPITPEMIEAEIRDALANLEDTHDLTVFLHKDDLALLERVNAPVLLATAGGEKLHFETSAEVTRGGCLIQTRFGVLDARRETKLELLKKAMET